MWTTNLHEFPNAILFHEFIGLVAVTFGLERYGGVCPRIFQDDLTATRMLKCPVIEGN